MDDITTTALTTFLASFLVKTAERASERLGEILPREVGALWGHIQARFRGRPAAEGAAQELAAQPTDPDNQAAFGLQLRRAAREDPAFAAELARLFEAAQRSQGAGALASGSGVAAGAGGVAVRGNVKGDIHVNAPAAATPDSGAVATDHGAAAGAGGVAIGGDVEGSITVGGGGED